MEPTNAPPPASSAAPAGFASRSHLAVQQASAKFRGAADWVVFFREVLGNGGLVDQLFPAPQEREAFCQSDGYLAIQKMLARLREQSVVPNEPMKMITVRMPASLHKSLREEAHALHTSVNKLCISKLVQVIDDELVPNNWGERDGNRHRADL